MSDFNKVLIESLESMAFPTERVVKFSREMRG
jgi:hypothetical protein